MTRAAFAAGAPVPEVFGEVTLEGRFGIVLTRLDGPTLWQLLLTRAMTSEQAGAILATLYISVHKTPRRQTRSPCAIGSPTHRESPVVFRNISPLVSSP
jgi:hypothetical protein